MSFPSADATSCSAARRLQPTGDHPCGFPLNRAPRPLAGSAIGRFRRGVYRLCVVHYSDLYSRCSLAAYAVKDTIATITNPSCYKYISLVYISGLKSRANLLDRAMHR